MGLLTLTFRPIRVWPPGWTPRRWPETWSPFTATYSDTLVLLDRELTHLRATHPTLQVHAPAARIRADGQLAANARVTYPGVILSFDTSSYGTLTYACNRFCGSSKRPGWQENLRAIALGLESLRRVERYGIATRGQQYAGWAEIGSGIPVPPGQRTMTIEQAARILTTALDADGGDVIIDARGTVTQEMVDKAYKRAARLLHPDHGGTHDKFLQLTEAVTLLRSQR